MKKQTLSAIVIARNEELMLEACLKTLSWCDEILVVDDGSTDKTALIAESFGARVISFHHQSFSRKREEGGKHAKGDWLFYVDADERVTPTLAKEILVNIETASASALSINRTNLFYGQVMTAGGWQDDFVTRVFNKQALQRWQGEVHESPIFKGQAKRLNSNLIHLTHRTTADGLKKSAVWTEVEADQLFKANLPPVGILTVLRKGGAEWFRRAVLKKGYKDGPTGQMEALIQGLNKMLIYIQVWEKQKKPTITELYAVKEREIEIAWEQEKRQ